MSRLRQVRCHRLSFKISDDSVFIAGFFDPKPAHSGLLSHLSLGIALTLWCVTSFATDSTDEPFPLITPVDGIYVHLGRHEDITVANGGDIANTGFIVGDSSVMIVDPGGSPKVGKLLQKAVRSVTNLPISHVVLTHVHPDHIFGSGVFAEGPELVAHRRYPDALVQRAQFYLDRFSGLFADGNGTLPAPTVLVDESLRIDLGNRTVVLQTYPTAHTDHDLSVYDERTRTLWASDLVFAQRIPALDGSVIGWLNVTRKLLASDAKLIIPGHGFPGPPVVVVQPQLRYLEKLTAGTRTEVAANARLSEAVERVATDENERWLLFELHHAGNITRAFTELEWE